MFDFDFPDLLNRVLHGDEDAIQEWYSNRNRFKAEQKSFASDQIELLLTKPDHPQRKHALLLKVLMYLDVDYRHGIPIAEMLDEAILLRNPNAMYEQARILYSIQKNKSKPNYDRVIYLLRDAIILSQHCGAMTEYANMLRLGHGMDVNYTEAIAHLNKAMRLFPDNFLAFGLRAEMYQCGQGGEIDYDKAIKFYRDSHERGGPLPPKICTYEKIAVGLKKLKATEELKILYSQIEKMSRYGQYLEDLYRTEVQQNKQKLPFIEPSNLILKKGKKAQELSLKLHNMLTQFLADMLAQFLEDPQKRIPSTKKIECFKDQFSVLLHSEDKYMKEHRQIWKPIVANILVALTGIGLLALLSRVLINLVSYKPMSFNEWGFFAKTNSQECLEALENDVAWDTLDVLDYKMPHSKKSCL